MAAETCSASLYSRIRLDVPITIQAKVLTSFSALILIITQLHSPAALSPWLLASDSWLSTPDIRLPISDTLLRTFRPAPSRRQNYGAKGILILKFVCAALL